MDFFVLIIIGIFIVSIALLIILINKVNQQERRFLELNKSFAELKKEIKQLNLSVHTTSYSLLSSIDNLSSSRLMEEPEVEVNKNDNAELTTPITDDQPILEDSFAKVVEEECIVEEKTIVEGKSTVEEPSIAKASDILEQTPNTEIVHDELVQTTHSEEADIQMAMGSSTESASSFYKKDSLEQDDLEKDIAEEDTVEKDNTPQEKPFEPYADGLFAAQARMREQANISKNTQEKSPNFLELLVRRFTDNWMTWIGAITLSIGGFFFTRYLIELGVFPPWLRLILGCIFGALLVAAAYWLDKKGITFEKSTNYTPAAIASAGVITCFSMVYLAYFKYDFLTTYLAFGLLALVCVIGGLLALRLGPILAAVGFVGAYAIPALVSSGSHQFWGLFTYLCLISLFTIYITNQLKIKWLWRFIYVGHFGWYWIGIVFLLIQSSPELFMSQLSAVCVYAALSFIGFVYYPVFGASIKTVSTRAYPLDILIKPTKSNILMLTIFFPAIIYIIQHVAVYYSLPLSMFALLIFMVGALLYMPMKNSRWDAWITMPLATVAMLIILKVISNEWTDDATSRLFSLSGVFIFEQIMAVILFVYGFFMSQRYTKRHLFHWLTLSSPLCVVGLSYVAFLYSSSESPPMQWISETVLLVYWGLVLFFSAIGLGYSAEKYPHSRFSPIFWSVANVNVAFAIFLWFDGHVASLFIALQILILSQLQMRLHCKFPHIILKALVSLLLLRLTVSPWMSSFYEAEFFSVHATLIVYPISLLLLWLARSCWQNKVELKVWFEGAILHLLALFVTTELSYQLLGSYPSLFDSSFYENMLLSFSWVLLAGVYLYRAKATPDLFALYKKAIFILLIGAALFQWKGIMFHQPFISPVPLGRYPIVNWSIVAWLLPALILLAMVWFDNKQSDRKVFTRHLVTVFWWIIGIALFVFVNVEIRHYYQGYLTGRGTLQGAITNSEMYVYSVVWLIISMIIVIVASMKKLQMVQKVGLALVGLVILKVFLIDMSNLTGLLRAISFIALGGSLIGLGWLFQKLRKPNDEETVK